MKDTIKLRLLLTLGLLTCASFFGFMIYKDAGHLWIDWVMLIFSLLMVILNLLGIKELWKINRSQWKR